MQEKRYFITGGAGFVGSHTVDLLVAAGATVTVFDKKTWEEAVHLHHQEGKIAYVQGNICDFKTLEQALSGHTHVLHLAAEVSVTLSVEEPIMTHEVNVNGTLNVFEAARRQEVSRVVYASSAAVYGEQEMHPVDESLKLAPQSPYGLHKAINEEYAMLYARTYGLSTMGLRYFNIFGERQDPSSPYSGVISIFVDRIKQGNGVTVYGDGTAIRDFVYVGNIAKANILALDTDAQGVCNIGSGVETTISELIEVVGVLADVSVDVIYESKRPGDIERSCSVISLAEELIGYTPELDLKAGLERLITASA